MLTSANFFGNGYKRWFLYGMAISMLLILFTIWRAQNRIPPVTLAFGSCIRAVDSPIWESIQAQNPDLFLLLGDNFYLSDKDLHETGIAFQRRVQARYDKLFSNQPFSELVSAIPTVAIWDDHDFGPDNSDGSFRQKNITHDEFNRIFDPLDKLTGERLNVSIESMTSHPRVARSFVYHNIRFVLTDGRWYRRAPLSPDGKVEAYHAFFGEEQLSWIEDQLAKEDVGMTIVVSGGQLLSEKKVGEELSRFDGEYRRFLKAVEDSPQTVLILSGDRHYSEILERQLGSKKVLELTSSPLTSAPRSSLKMGVEEARLEVLLGQKNFGVVTINQQRGVEGTIGFYNDSGMKLLERSF